MKKSRKFFLGCLFFIIGIAVGEAVVFPWYYFLLLFCFLVFLIFYFKKYRRPLIVIFLFLLGIFWNNFLLPNINDQHISFYNEQKITFQAKITAEPDVRLDKQKLTVRPTDYKGKVLVSLSLYPEYEYGDLLEINCTIKEPTEIEDFRYDRYLARYGIYSVCYRPQIKVLEKDQANFVVASILKLKKNVENRINRTVAEPQASLVAGILIGSRQGIPQTLLNQFNITGITHIIAISGFNITIIVILLLNLSKHLYINRKKAIWLILIGLIFFVIITGASASVVRAAIMGMIVVFSKHLGRVSRASNILILSAVAMLLFNPKILIWDAGFQLSFLATIGLIYLSPKLERFFQWVPKKFALQENFVSTLSAIIFTLPLILFQFGRLSIVAPLVNLLVLPIIPLSMFVGFIQVIGSFVHSFIGQIIGWVSWVLLEYVIKVVEFFSSFSWASVGITVPLWLMLLLYLVLFVIIKKKKKSN